MDGKELQIGNYIEAFGVKRIVAGIFGGQELMLDTYIPSLGYRESTLSFRCKYANPIPLTKELLEKNFGQRRGKGGVFYPSLGSNRIYDYIIEYYQDDFGFCRDHGGLLCRIKYVHQLQNAMQICGIDKEIVL